MRGVHYLSDGHHVDDAGNLISYIYVDFRDPAERSPITTLKKASSKRHAVPGCETIRISKPSCFRVLGEGLVKHGDNGDDGFGPAGASAGSGATPASQPEPATEDDYCGANGWIYCASVEPETAEERAAWREAMPREYEAVSPIRRPRAFARALGAMAAEQVGPRGRVVLLQNTVDGRMFSTAHRSQTVYHGPVVYADDLHRRLERASSNLELLLSLVFLKDVAHRAQREYRFVVWAEKEPVEDRVDLEVSPALLDAVWRGRQVPEDSGFVLAGAEESSAVAEIEEGGPPRVRLHVEALPAFAPMSNPTVAPRRYDVEGLPSDLREAAKAHAAVEALREAVERASAEGGTAAAAAWHAEPVVHFLCSTFGDAVAGVRVSEDGFIVITAELPGDDLVEASIAVGPEGTCACRISAGVTHLASTAPDVRSFEQMLKNRLPEVGVRGKASAGQSARSDDMGVSPPVPSEWSPGARRSLWPSRGRPSSSPPSFR